MLDFTPIRNKEKTYAEFSAEYEMKDLRTLTNEMVDYLLRTYPKNISVI